MMTILATDLELFRSLFFHRQDTFAEMYKYRTGDRKGDVGYSPACLNRWKDGVCNNGKCRQCSNFLAEPLTDDVIASHLHGNRTIGTYLVSPQGTVNLLVIDADINKAGNDHPEIYKERVKALSRQLYDLALHHGLNPIIEDSGNKGGHIWMFFAAPIQAARAQQLGTWLVANADEYEGCHAEVFPKQGSIDTYGNLVKVPMGIHLKTGRRCLFVDPETLEGTNETQLDILRSIKTVPLDTVDYLFAEYDIAPKQTVASRGNGAVPQGGRLPCLAKMWAGVTEGCRDEVAFRLAVHLYKQGMPPVFAENALCKWDSDYNTPPMGDAIILQKVGSAYKGNFGYGCSSPLIQPFCDPSCPIYKKRQEPEPIVEEEVRTSPELRFLKVDTTDSSMIFCRAGLEYRCSNIDSKGKEGIKATVELRQGEKMVHKDRLGLSVANRRKAYATGSTTSMPELDYQSILNDISQLDGLIRLKQAEIFAEELGIKKTEYVMSIEEEQAALNLLKSPALLHKVYRVIEQLGVVGEKENKLVIFLGYTSRILDEPMQIYIKGESSSGKSFVSRKLLGLLPKECYIELTDMTPQALFYMQDISLSHKVIILFERHGSEKADYAIRSGVSEGELSIAVPIKDPETNKMRTERLVVKGPFMFLTTTTDAFLNPENETRNISLYSDDSEEQTATIRNSEVDQFLLIHKDVSPADLLIWQNAQRLLRPYPVRIPYVRDIADRFPKKPVRVRRDFTHFIRLIRTVTILHQFQRQVLMMGNGEQFLDATIGDYYIAKKLAEKIFAKAIMEIGPKAIEVWAYCFDNKYEKQNEATGEKTLRVFTYESIGKGIDWKAGTVKKWVRQLNEGGFISWVTGEEEGGDKKHKGGRQKARFSLTDKEYSDMSVLPEASELIAKYPALAGDIYNPFTGEESDEVSSF